MLAYSPGSQDIQEITAPMIDPTQHRIILGVTGGIAAYKSVALARLLIKAGAEVQVVMTAAA